MSATLADLRTITTPESYALEMPSFLARMAAAHGPIYKRDWGNGQTTVYLVGPEANRLVLHTHRDHFSHDLGWTPIVGDILGRGRLNIDDPDHARDRRLMNPAFAAYMDRYLPIMRRVDDLPVKSYPSPPTANAPAHRGGGVCAVWIAN